MKKVSLGKQLIITFLLSLLAIMGSVIIFPSSSSLMALLSITMFLSFYYYHLHTKDKKLLSLTLRNHSLLYTSKEIIKTQGFFFIGIFLAIFCMTAFLSESHFYSLFSIPMEMISFEPTISQAFYNKFLLIAIGILTAIFYGFGGILLLTLSTFIVSTLLLYNLKQLTFQSVLYSTPVFSLFGIHGILEVLAYLLCSYIAFLLFLTIEKYHFSSKKFQIILQQIVVLFSVLILLVLSSGTIEILF